MMETTVRGHYSNCYIIWWSLVFIIIILMTAISSQDCDIKFYSDHQKNGTFSSPKYPNAYPVDTTCHFVFQGQGQERVQIVFIDLDLRHPIEVEHLSIISHGCEDSDSVSVSVLLNGVPQDIGVYCGVKRPPKLMSHDNQMNVTFTSHSMVLGRGFKANYSFVTDFGIKAGEHNKDLVCGFTFRSNKTSNGTFTSPNFPGLYPRNTECHYLFYGSTNECIYITFPYFDVEGLQPGCLESTDSDYVEFSNFNIRLMDRKMSRFCGSKDSENAKKAVNSDGNFFRVTFKSNHVYDATGFEAFYQFRKVEDPYSRNTRKLSSSCSRLSDITTSIALLLTLHTIFYKLNNI